MTAVVTNGDVDAGLRAACKQVKNDVHALQIYTQEHATVEPGSPIDDDNHVLTEFSMRELIGAPIWAAVDDLVVTTVFLNNFHTVREYGLPTSIRSAMTGAGTALWLMHPNVDERRLRALRMSYQIAKNELNFVKGVPVDWNGVNAGPTLARKQHWQLSREQKLQRVLDNGTNLGYTEKQVKKRPEDSLMVEEGAKRLPPNTFHCPPDEHMLSDWRLLSGRAHGLVWPLRYIPEPPKLSLDRLLGHVHNALTLLNCAVDYYTDMVKAP